MKRINFSVLCVILFAASVARAEGLEQRRPGKRWWASVAAMVGASALDSHSSWGRQELNPILAGADGRFGGKALAIKAGVAGAVVAAQYLILRKNPGAGQALSYGNFGMAGVFSAVAYRNHTNLHGIRPAPQLAASSYLLAGPSPVN